MAGFADGVIVGSAIVRRMLDAPDTATGIAEIRALCGELADGTRRLVGGRDAMSSRHSVATGRDQPGDQ
ncbi:hypothetical protein [Kutzneria kofuensis]|uniref:hypothetical protein n=1 Tax=Kutzneria kofuensis TaxID=103725 RepID=UPI0031EEEFF0